MGKLQGWLLSLLALLGSQAGVEKDPKKPLVVEEETDDDNIEIKPGEEDGGEETEEEDEEDEEGAENADDDSGNNVGKDRSKYVPRKRFDEVNSKAQRVDELVENGVLVEGTDGKLYLNPKSVKKQKSSGEADEEDDEENYHFTKDEVDDASWPLVQKINRGFKKFDGLTGQFTYIVRQQGAELAIIRDYPEILQKDSPLKKKAQDLLKNDAEFKNKYKGDPEKGYWAVKRAAEMLSGRQPAKKKANKSKFIIGRSDGGKGGKNKIVDFSKMTKDQLDELERQEHDRIHGGRKK